MGENSCLSITIKKNIIEQSFVTPPYTIQEKGLYICICMILVDSAKGICCSHDSVA